VSRSNVNPALPALQARTAPSRSVRSTAVPAASSRSTTARAGCPQGLPAPTEIRASPAPTRETKGAVDDVSLP
jgi:hypothetical protein